MTNPNWMKLLDSDDEALFARLGAQITGLGAGIGDGDDAGLGRRWWAINLDAVRKLVCASPAIKSAAQGKDWERAGVCTAIFDVLLVQYGAPVSTTLAALVVRQGVLELCARAWRDDQAIRPPGSGGPSD